MTQSLDLQQANIEACFVHDGAGDLLTTSGPLVSARQEAPAYYLAWTSDGYVHAFRHNVVPGIRSQVRDLVATQWPFPASGPPPDVESYLRVIGGTGKWSSGPDFVFPEQCLADREAVRVTRVTVGILQPDFTGWEDEIDVAQPMFASVVDGKAVSVCGTVRRSDCGVVAGVSTVESYRREGHAKRVVSAWGSTARKEGFLAFYSTEWENEASISVANSLELQQIGASFGVA